MTNNNAINATNVNHAILVGNGVDGYSSIATSATAGVPLVSNGASADPSFSTGLVAGGCTGSTSFNVNGVVISNTTTTGNLASITLTDGQIPIGRTGNTTVAANITAGAGISITNAAGSITVATVAGIHLWTEVTGTSQAAAVNNGYVANNAALVTITLPATAAFGSVVRVVGKGAGLWKLLANTGQIIHFGNTDSTVAGYVSSSQRYDCIEVLCTVANTEWTVSNGPMGGNFTVA